MGGSACLGTWGTLVEVEALKSLMTKLQVIPVRFTCLFFLRKKWAFRKLGTIFTTIGSSNVP